MLIFGAVLLWETDTDIQDHVCVIPMRQEIKFLTIAMLLADRLIKFKRTAKTLREAYELPFYRTLELIS